MSFALAAIAVGSVISGMGEYKAAKARAEARRKKALDNRLRSKEVLERLEINIEEARLDAMDVKAGQLVRSISSGLSGQSAMRILADTQTKLSRQIEADRREAEFTSDALLRGATVEEGLAKEEISAGRVRRFGSLLRGGAAAGRAF